MSLFTYTIYEKPADFPDAWVVRRWEATGDVEDRGVWCLAESLEAARESIPPDLICFTRSPEDDPTIVETWL